MPNEKPGVVTGERCPGCSLHTIRCPLPEHTGKTWHMTAPGAGGDRKRASTSTTVRCSMTEYAYDPETRDHVFLYRKEAHVFVGHLSATIRKWISEDCIGVTESWDDLAT